MDKDMIGPTPEQIGAFELAEIVDKRRGGISVKLGRAFRRRRQIDVLRETNHLSTDEFKALQYYRHHADVADRSPLRDSIATLNMIRGSGDEPTVMLLNAIRIRDDCERAAGTLSAILRAVVVDDVSLSQWVISQGGGSEVNRRNGRGTVVQALKRPLEIAKLEFRIAAQRVQAELDARGPRR